MPVSRKNRSIKKSSKRSKNARTNKKTRKHMRKMRGSGNPLELGVSQAVDFIIYSGDQVLVNKNPNVTNNSINDWALIGTFAASGSKDGNDQIEAVKTGIAKYNISKDEVDLTRLRLDVAKLLLKKKLNNKNVEKMIEDLTTINNVPVETDKFYNVEGDKRLSETPCTPETCMMKTQLFILKVPTDANTQNKFLKNNMMWKRYDNQMIFPGHRTILRTVSDIFKSNPGFM